MWFKTHTIRKILLLLLITGAIAGTAYLYSFQIQSFTVKGNERFTGEEIVTGVFPGDKPPHTIVVWLRSLLHREQNVPFLDHYEVSLHGMREAVITVRELEIIGCLDYAGTYLYFSKTGALLKQQLEKEDDIPLYTGILPKTVIKYHQIETDRAGIFQTINQLAQLLKQYNLPIEQVHIDLDNQVTLYFADVTVKLGGEAYIEEKITELYGMYENLAEMSGTLDLSTYDPDADRQEFHFKQNG